MKSVFTNNFKRTQFLSSEDRNLVLFNTMLSKLTTSKTYNINLLNKYKQTIKPTYSKNIINVINSLIQFYSDPPLEISTFKNFSLHSSILLVINPIYLKYIEKNINDGIDPFIITILDLIKANLQN
jgi:hypothetical protein